MGREESNKSRMAAGDNCGMRSAECGMGDRGEGGEHRTPQEAPSAEMWTMDHRRWSIVGEPSEPQGSCEPQGEDGGRGRLREAVGNQGD